MTPTAEELCREAWQETSGSINDQWSVLRQGKRDGIVVLVSNPPCGGCRSPCVALRVYYRGTLADEVLSYAEANALVRRLLQKIHRGAL